MIKRILCLLFAILLSSCMGYGPIDEEAFDVGGDFGNGDEVTGKGLFITNEGNFMYGNASLSYYNPEMKHVENEVFARANGMKLGDVAQSMGIHKGVGWIVVNNSGVIFAISGLSASYPSRRGMMVQLFMWRLARRFTRLHSVPTTSRLCPSVSFAKRAASLIRAEVEPARSQSAVTSGAASGSTVPRQPGWARRRA